MNVTIKPGAATQDAAQIDSIVNQIREDMKVLNDAINSTIPSGIQTNWSEELLNSWRQYYGGDVDSTLAEMAASATNLRMAVEKTLQYSNEM